MTNLYEPQEVQLIQVTTSHQGTYQSLQQVCHRPMYMIGYLPMKMIYIVEELSVLFIARKCMSSC